MQVYAKVFNLLADIPHFSLMGFCLFFLEECPCGVLFPVVSCVWIQHFVVLQLLFAHGGNVGDVCLENLQAYKLRWFCCLAKISWDTFSVGFVFALESFLLFLV